MRSERDSAELAPRQRSERDFVTVAFSREAGELKRTQETWSLPGPA